VVQPWGGVKNLRIDRMTASSNYQGLTLKEDLGPVGSVEVFNVNLTATTEPPLEKGGYMLWLTKQRTCEDFPTRLKSVYVKPRPSLSLRRSVWPGSHSGLSCNGSGSSVVTWPRLSVRGGVRVGRPRGGSFVPRGVAGLSYASPGYAG
jgi:hypothetical protein